MTDSALRLATCSYRSFHPEMGVPVGTSIGKADWFTDRYGQIPQIDTLKPFGVFRRLDHLPLDRRIEAYHERLSSRSEVLHEEIHNLWRAYGGQQLVLLCWCHLPNPDVGPRGCHRRWAAEWFADGPQIEVPELGPTEPPAARTVVRAPVVDGLF